MMHIRGNSWTCALALSIFAFGAIGCPQTITTLLDDSGENGEADSGATTAGGRDARINENSRDGGGANDGTAPDVSDGGLDRPDLGIQRRDGGPDGGISRDAGDLRALRWGEMTLPSSTRLVSAIWGRSRTEIYAGTQGGKLLRSSDGQSWTQVWSDPDNATIEAIWGTPLTLFVASDTSLHVHSGGIQPMPRSLRVGTHIYSIHGRGDTEVYLVADQQNGRGFYRYDGSRIVTINEPTDIATLASVFSVPNGPVLVGGNGRLYTYDRGVFLRADIDWPRPLTDTDILYLTVWGIGQAGGRVFAVLSRHLIFERDATGAWRQSYLPFLASEGLRAVTGFDVGGTVEAYAAGARSSHGPIARFWRDTWTEDQFSGDADLWSLWAAGPDEYYAAGAHGSTVNGVILKGTR